MTSPGNEQIYEYILHAEHLPDKIEELTEANSSPSLSPYQLRKLFDLLLSEHQIPAINIWDYYKMDPVELNRGVPCPACFQIPMSRVYSRWKCSQCGALSQNAHQIIVEDFILLNGSISNEQCRQLFAIDSRHTARRLLNSMNLKTYGSHKNYFYIL